MPTRADLLAAAEGLAENARSAAAPGDSTAPDFDRASSMAAAAKVALEAAALAENTGASQIDQALEAIQELLAEAGVLDEATELEPGPFLERTFQALLAWRKEALGRVGYEVAYDALRELMEGLERDFIAGDTETSKRIAGRIRLVLDDATQMINRASQGVSDGQGQD